MKVHFLCYSSINSDGPRLRRIYASLKEAREEMKRLSKRKYSPVWCYWIESHNVKEKEEAL